MVWFNSIVQGVGSAVNWAMSNAGNIAGLLTSVTKVSTLYIPKDAAEEAEMPETSKDYFKIFKRAEAVLQEQAEKKVKAKEVEYGWDDPREPFSTRKGNLSGIWIRPTVFTNTSEEVPEMYRDLVKLFAELSIPTIMKRNDKDDDVAELVSQAIFPTYPKPPSQISSFDAYNNDHLSTYGIGLRNDDKSCQVFVGHSYYALPMGRSGTDNTWHCAVHVKMKSTTHSEEQYAKDMEEFRFMEIIEPSAVDVWLVTFQISWKAIKVARGGYKFLKEVLHEKSKTGYKVKHNFLDGQLQTVKIKAPAQKSPSETLFYLQEAVAQAVEKLNKNSPQMDFEVAAASTQYQTPYVVLMDSTLLTADNAVGDGMVVVSH
ncbi:hypothetical protein BGW36DRAFT_364560 [Talaromyces proteolyticus]|uniref:Uncharacterized protein n=1 Tax=Talaromyces proteolyticus TaxID=1131652 RepID=A0AAD4PUT9_9EURO|nr:uncharacterized protein BGW36DRAFT_364560 [Talaromyces proteolyticus]KAH8689816.1 hypothetical protein BGW36DRAFT_364560 [Talaromyces proteolyticus]